MKFAGFWIRLAAQCIDIAVLAPLIVFNLWLSGSSRYYFAYSLLPWQALNLVFYVYLVFRYGGTPGKLAFNLRVRMLDGSKILFSVALLRYSIYLILGLAASIELVIGSLKLSGAEFAELTRIQYLQEAEKCAPFYQGISLFSQIWILAEIAVLLLNSKRRSIHDFIAGTVVIINDKKNESESKSPPSILS